MSEARPGESGTDRFEAIRRRCESKGLESEIEATEFVDEDGEEYTYVALKVSVPAARGFRTVRISEERLVDFEASNFENWRFIDGYDAIWSAVDGAVEGTLSGLAPRFLASRIAAVLEQDRMRPDEEKRVELPSPGGGLRISIGVASQECTLLTSRFPPASRTTIRLDGVSIERHDEARDLLERFGNSVLFQLDLSLGVAVYLTEESQTLGMGARRRPSNPTIEPIAFEYDQEPMSLYWYARGARGMPLLQYLAYYQVLEFYFPIYANKEAQEVLRDKLKDPSFSATRDRDINRLLLAIRNIGAGVGGFRDERSQLRTTLNAVATRDDLRDFMEDWPQVAEVLASKGVVSSQRIALKPADADILNDAANRIYDIRCRIVHTKDGQDGEAPLMLPFSKEARNLGADIALIQFFAKEALIAGSRQLRA